MNPTRTKSNQVIKLHHMLMILNIKLSWRFRSVSGLDDSLDVDIEDIRITSTAAVNLQVLGDIVQRDDGGLLLTIRVKTASGPSLNDLVPVDVPSAWREVLLGLCLGGVRHVH